MSELPCKWRIKSVGSIMSFYWDEIYDSREDAEKCISGWDRLTKSDNGLIAEPVTVFDLIKES